MAQLSDSILCYTVAVSLRECKTSLVVIKDSDCTLIWYTNKEQW